MTTSTTQQTSQAEIGRRGGDLSHRVARRRAELGLSIEEVAQATGIDPGYLNYLEGSPNAHLSAGSLILLAMALKTSPEALLGGHSPLLRDGAGGRHPDVQELNAEQCLVHLSTGEYGRLVYTRSRGPVAIPVNYEFTEGQIVISTDPDKAVWLEGLLVVGFEVDRVVDGLSEGWSVMVSGMIRIVDDPDEQARLSTLALAKWNDGGQHTLIAITPLEITGRVIVHGSPWDE